MRKKKNFLTFIFDLDGTIVDSLEDIADSVNWVLKKFKLPERSQSEIRQFIGGGVHELFRKSIGTDDEILIDKAVKIFEKYYIEHCVDKTVLYPEVREMLDFLKSKKLAIVSNKPYKIVMETLKKLSILNDFKVVLGAESAENKKPHPEPVIKALKLLNSSPECALMIGDGTTDIQAAKQAGIFTCAVTYGYRDKNELMKLKPDFMIERIGDLRKIVG